MNDIVTIKELGSYDYELRDIFATRQTWKKNVLFNRDTPRKNNGLIFLNGCDGRYTDSEGNSFFAPHESFVCLPRGSTYSVLNLDCSMAFPDAYWLEFNIVQNGNIMTLGEVPFAIDIKNSRRLSGALEEITRCCEAPRPSPAMLKGLVYTFLADVARQVGVGELPCSEYATIAPALKLLEEDPTRDISVRELADICYLSEGGFRRIFKKYSGKSPLEYRIDIKLGIAKSMLENTDMTVFDISQTLGFDDVAYFCKLFKKKIGTTPTAYRKRES